MSDSMDDIVLNMSKFSIEEENMMINYINTLNIDSNIKNHLLMLLENDNYNNYIEIYNICIENDIELPPIF